MEQQTAHNTENGGVCADTERQSRHYSGRKRWTSFQHACRVPNITPKLFQCRKRLHSPAILPEESGVAKLPARGTRSFIRQHSLPRVPFGKERDVSCDFVVEIKIAVPLKEAAQLPNDSVEHRYFSGTSWSTRPITPAIRSQFSVSRASCRRPVRVIA